MTLISEAGLYRLTQRSSKPQARAFDRRVRLEVLPQIRGQQEKMEEEDAAALSDLQAPDYIPITSAEVAGDEVQTVDARALHEWLDNRDLFTNWIKARINKFGFERGVDYVRFGKSQSKNGRGGHNRTDYFLTLDMAKELAMVENNDRGWAARKYFIEVEKRALATVSEQANNGAAPAQPTGDVIRFDFRDYAVRTVTIAGEPWFVATDVCRALGLSVTKGAVRHLNNLECDEKMLVTRNQCLKIFEGTRGGAQMVVISEAGLYKLIQRSSKPKARAFDRWVRHEVLPQIRKTGSYRINDDPAPALPEPPKTYAEALRALADALHAPQDAPRTHRELP